MSLAPLGPRDPLVLEGFVPYPEDLAAHYRSAGYWTDQTMAEPLFESAARLPDKTAIVAGETRRT